MDGQAAFIFTKILSSALADVCVSRLFLKETSLSTVSLMLNQFITEKYCPCCLWGFAIVIRFP